MTIITPELKAYAVAEVSRMGIKAEEMTPALMGQVLKQALKKMDEAACKYIDNSNVQRVFLKSVYEAVR